MLRRIILIIVVYGVILVCTSRLIREVPEAAIPIWTMVGAILAILSCLAYFFRQRTVGGINPFAVYLWLVIGFGLCVAFGSILVMLGPIFLLTLMTVLAIAGAFAWSRNAQLKNRALRAEMGLCSTCGYDLRATDEICPECGSPLPAEIERVRRIRDEISRSRQQPASNE